MLPIASVIPDSSNTPLLNLSAIPIRSITKPQGT